MVWAIETATLIELISEVVSVVVGAIVFFVVRRVIPGFGFLLHQRAMRMILISALVFSLAEILAGFQLFSGLGTSLIAVVIEDVLEVLVIVLAGMAVVTLYRSEREEVTSLRRSADLDELTVLPNRAFFRRAAERRFLLSRENGIPLACIVLDIDDFKPYNDEYTHAAGDQALVCVAEALRESIRADDIVARYGGEEFVIMMNGGSTAAAAIADRIRSAIERHCSPENNTCIKRHITVSLGVAPLVLEMRTPDDLIAAADEQMYRAKRAGKNRVSVIP
jgi:diguanylate cyclase (GGDEF)-like protein